MSWLARLKTTQAALSQITAPDACISATLAMQAANDPAGPALDSQPRPELPADKPKQTFMDWQDTWRELDQASQRHHFACAECIAAGKGYGLRCGTGAALYRAYTDASADRSALDW